MFKIEFYFTGEGACVIDIYAQRGPGPGNWYIAKPITLEFEKLKEMEVHEPTLKMNHLEGGFLLDAFRTALAEYGAGKGGLQGKVEAMKEHIDDLRMILRIPTEKSKRLLTPEDT